MMTHPWSETAVAGSRPAPRVGTETNREAPADRRAFTSVVARLLDDAKLTPRTNPEIARAGITPVSALPVEAQDRPARFAPGTPATLARGGLAPWQARRVTALIETSLRSSIRVRDFNAITGLSTSHFARAFKASFGETVHTYIVRRRMERAQELMLTTNESLCQIALECGLCDQAHFSRLFRRIFGITPGLWRRQWLSVDLETAANRS
jgi:AraC-like DNA-binding protein